MSHMIDLEVNGMFNIGMDKEHKVEAVYRMKGAVKQIKNAAIFCNLTDYCPVLYCKT